MYPSNHQLCFLWASAFNILHSTHISCLTVLLTSYFRDLKVVIVGDADVGKTCLLHRYLHGEFYDQTPNVSWYFPQSMFVLTSWYPLLCAQEHKTDM